MALMSAWLTTLGLLVFVWIISFPSPIVSVSATGIFFLFNETEAQD